MLLNILYKPREALDAILILIQNFDFVSQYFINESGYNSAVRITSNCK